MPYDSQLCPSCKKPFFHCRCSRYCAECGGLTNHTTRQHQEEEARDEHEDP